MRLFVAVPLPGAVRAQLATAVEPIRGGDDGARWVSPRLWHVTVAFLGEVPDADVPAVQAHWAERARETGPLELRLVGGGAFPDARRARVLWAGVDVDLRAWTALAADDAVPHVTLARYRPAQDVRPAVAALAAVRTSAWRCHGLALVESRPSPDAERRYVRVATLPAR
ncbi:2'-5' RNA ligase [Beutenbergia cavernae DSM 12333]|uniref:RNA 2',3'-cyclic phosphodiesterase n=1 Tax=Beutenbergia cavernae (strain ATCC BAA-8 / DSM 12333 / CCUG 43141 / JCM 11478 / NBRC 16432 / NCIMB 13614 / HKI 0122) TaxID=471853 RepID=C5C6G0_BEUC1|nr:RNA 2',3'-cyclic phosphodiesterase [Beutenbergia cavernae]ACQ80366.1 2'-5' RNA ligase [Beutenbergia cavernae DSM 12333]